MVKAWKGLEMWETKSSIYLRIFSCWGIFGLLGVQEGCQEKGKNVIKNQVGVDNLPLWYAFLLLYTENVSDTIWRHFSQLI